MKPSEVSKALGISTSTLRKYSLLFEKEDIIFKRSDNNSRLYTDTQVVALQEVVTDMKNGTESLEKVIKKVSNDLKGATNITQETAATDMVSQRYADDVATVMLQEIESLKEVIEKQNELIIERDKYFVEILEQLHEKIDELKEQKALPPVEEPEQEEEPLKKGFFSRFFK